MSRYECETCGVSVEDGAVIHRTSPKGELFNKPITMNDKIRVCSGGQMNFVCDRCNKTEHDECRGDTWCDCRHRKGRNEINPRSGCSSTP